MREDQHRFLSLLGRLPARLTAEQVAWVINCQPHDIPVLVSARLLKPLGNPLPNSVKYFATRELVELMEDRAWLAKVTNAITEYWQHKNRQRRCRSVVEAQAAGAA
ncbi:MAG TPA: hypothetical protein VL171_11735 [Verrucomicrobiae bacterium]|nr:hypothetical protein [Verrucomicrobiae bacterium]